MKKIIVFLMVVSLLVGCAGMSMNEEAGTKKGAAIGAVGGAILGQIIGGDTAGTLIGAGLGAAAGGMIGKSHGSKVDEQEAALRRELAAIETAKIQRSADILSITFGSDMLFDSGSAGLKPGARQGINHVSLVLNKYTDTNIRVDGHTDNQGSQKFNQNLSELRAANVKLSLVEQGVHPSRIRTIGYGASAPIALNDTDIGRRMNRRVVITIAP